VAARCRPRLTGGAPAFVSGGRDRYYFALMPSSDARPADVAEGGRARARAGTTHPLVRLVHVDRAPILPLMLVVPGTVSAERRAGAPAA